MLQCSCGQTGRKMIQRTSKYYLAHFIHLPVVIIYAIIIGEDTNTLALISLLMTIILGVSYGYNLLLTVTIIKIQKGPKFQFVAYIFPPFMLIVTKPFWDESYNSLDFGNETTKWYLIISSLIINTLSYYLIEFNKRKIKPAHNNGEHEEPL